MPKRGEGAVIAVDLDRTEGVLRIDLGRGSMVRGAAFPPGDVVLIRLEPGFEVTAEQPDELASWDDFVGLVLEGEIVFAFGESRRAVGANMAFWVDPPDGVSSSGATVVGTRARTPGG
jgi:hypothetical protein